MRDGNGEVDYKQLNGKQLVNIIVNLKKDYRVVKSLSKLKDDLVQQVLQDNENVKREMCSFEVTIQSNEKLIREQKIVIDDLNRKNDNLRDQLTDTKSNADGKTKLVDAHKDKIQAFARKLKDAENYIHDQNYVIDQLKKKLSDSKNEGEEVKRALKDRYLERLDKAKQEMDEERDKMARKLKQMREFYDIEGRDLQKQIHQLKEELDLLRRADFNRPDQSSTSRGKGRKRPSSTTNRDGTTARRARGRGGRASSSRKVPTPEVDSTLELADDEVTAYRSERSEIDAFLDEIRADERKKSRSRSPSLSPKPWKTSRSEHPKIDDTHED